MNYPVLYSNYATTAGRASVCSSSSKSARCWPRCILASGLSADESLAARSILEEEDSDRGGVTPLVLLTPEIADERVGDVLTNAAAISSSQVSVNLYAYLV